MQTTPRGTPSTPRGSSRSDNPLSPRRTQHALVLSDDLPKPRSSSLRRAEEGSDEIVEVPGSLAIQESVPSGRKTKMALPSPLSLTQLQEAPSLTALKSSDSLASLAATGVRNRLVDPAPAGTAGTPIESAILELSQRTRWNGMASLCLAQTLNVCV